MSCEHVEHDLDAYIDRELDSEAATLIRAHIAECPACLRRVAEREALGRLVRSAPYHAAPERLRGRLSAQSARSRSARRLLTWAAAAVLVVGVAAGVSVVQRSAARPAALVDEIVDGHVRSLMADHLLDVQSGDQHTVKPWFLGKLDFSPPVADLAQLGFPLAGGRLDYLEGRPVAALVYLRRQHTINVFVSRERGPTLAAVQVRSLRGFHVHHWMRDGMSFWAVSDLNDAELTEFVRALKGE